MNGNSACSVVVCNSNSYAEARVAATLAPPFKWGLSKVSDPGCLVRP